MRAASRESLADLRSHLVETVSSRASQGADVTEIWPALAGELRDVARLLAAEPGLRRSLADPTRQPDARARLLDTLFKQRVSAIGLAILDAAVRERWSSAGDLLDTIELLAIDAELEFAAGSDSLAEVEDELFRFNQIVLAHPDLLGTLGDSTVDVAQRAGLIETLLRAKAQPVTTRLVIMALYGLGGRSFPSGLARLVELVAQRRESQVAYVRTVVALTPEQETQLTDHLNRVYGQKISLKVRLDPSLVGGAIVEIGDDRYDGSVARLLEQARTKLAA
ncbi:MAG TPA: F0F1 ATP synthase subunit delta [Mycobacteriales bacterium]|jgi:F-type H+-transporting ATPase subunit delta|nr:F0F1 ATP synthase subunit delta [Mycobacteriales bacterium]